MIRKTIQWLTLACLALAFTVGFLVKPNVTYAAPLNYTVPGYSSAVVTSSFAASTTAVTAEGTSYDYARYAANGSVVNFGQGTGKKSLSIVGGQRLVITNTSASGVLLKTVTRELGASYTSTPALKKYLLFPGQSMKATNLITSSESIDVGGKNSHADYNANDIPNTYDRTHAGGTMIIPAREGIAITNTGTTSYEVLAPYEVFSFASRSNPAVFVKTLQQGQHLEALNVTPYTFTMYFTHKNYDYAIYDAAGVLDSYGHTGYTSDMLTAGRKIIVSNYSDVPLVIEGPYDALPTKARAYPALYTQTLTSGQSLLVKNTSSESYALNLKGAYDFAQYSANGSVADYGRKITTTAGTKIIPAGGSIVITKTDGGTAEVVGPPDGFTFTGRTDPALFIGSIAVGQSYEATNRLSGNGSFTMNGLYDYAMYDSSGNINNYYAKRSLGSFSISAGERAAFTNVGSVAAEIIAPYDAFRFVARANPVSFNKTLVAGETVQADNISLKSFTVSLNNQHHYVTYDTGNAVSEFGNPQTADSHIVDDTERIIISNSGTAPIVASGPYDAFRLTDRSAPALYKGFLANGQSMRLTNTSPTLFHLNMSGTYDQASYKPTGEPRSSKRKETSLGQILYNSERITLTGSGSSVLQILTPNDVTLVQSSTNPALAVKELAVGQSAQAKNTSTYNDRVDLTGKHDVMDYDTAGNPDSYARGRTIAYRDVDAGKHVSVMNTGTTAMEVYGPYELFAITSRANPVTFSRVLTANESMELRNQTGKLFPVYSTGLYDLAQYDPANDVTDVEREHGTTVKNVSGLNRLAVTNAQASSMAIEGPYDVFTLTSRANPALFERTLAPRQSMEAVFKGVDDASVHMTGKYDYSLFDQNGLKTYARQQNIIKNRLVNTGQRIAVMNTDVQSIVVYGAYDVFDNNARTNPVTFQRTLAPGESFEATNKELTPYEVYPSGLYDFVEFAADQDVRELGRDQTAALEIISSGNRIALTNANSLAITVEGAYDAFQLTNRTNPALFERTLQPGSSFEAAYSGTKDANVKMTGVYDLALYDAAGDIKSYYRERNASIGQAVTVGEKAAIMNSGTTNMVAFGAYDLFQISNRANPVSFVRTLSGDGTLEIKQKTNKRMSLYLDGTYDHAEYAADGSVNSYGAGATQKEQIISVDAKFVLTPSATHTVTVSGAYDAFDITQRMIRAVTIKSLDPGASYSLRNISPDSFNLRILGKYDYQIYDLWGNMQRFGNGSLVNPRVIDSTERMLITNADVAPITVMAPTDAINVTDGGNANEFVKALAIGETLVVKNQSSGASTINLSGKYDYALYDSAGAPVRYLREATNTAISVPAGHKLVITSRIGTGTVVTGGALAFLVTEQDEPALRIVPVSFKNTVELTNISPKVWSFTSSGTMDWASYNSQGTVLGYASRDTAATHELVLAEKMIVTSPLSQSLTIWGPYESFGYVDRTDPALEQETLKADQTVQAKNLTSSTQTLKAGGSFTYRSGSGSEQPGQSPLNVNAGATLLLTNTSGAEYLVFAPFGAIDLSFPGANGTPISGIGAADKVKTLDPSDYDPQTFHADPIDTATGAQIINRTLLTAHGAVPIPFQAQYHSLLTGTGDLGVGWSHNFEMKLEAGANNATVYWNAFRSNVFNKAADGTYSSTDKATRLDHLTKKADGTYVLERNDGTFYRFTAAGRLTEIEEKSGLKLAFGYAADGALTTISDPLTGAALTLSYDAAGRVAEVADPAARSVQFSYDAAGRLNEITDAAGNVTTYSYDSSNRIVSASSEGVQLFENTYDDEGRVIKQQDAVSGHAPTTFSYEEKDKQLITTITNRNGDVQKLTHDAQYQLLQTEDSLGNKMTFTYDAQGNRLTATNQLNQTISYVYDDRRNLIRSTDYTGAQVNMSYDNEDNLLSATGPDGNTMTYTYDNMNRLISVTDTDGQVTTYAYDAAGMLLSATDPKGAQTSYTYSGGRLVSMNNAAGEVTTYGYDTAGRMASVTDAAGNTSQLVYNADDQLLSDTNALGHAYSYAYDKQGFLASEVDARGNTTHYTYDNNGNLTQVVNALNQASQLIYDAEGRLIEAVNPLGDSVKIVYDAVGNVLTQTNAEGESVRYVYDSLYRLVEAYNADNIKVYEVVYDAKGNPVTIKDALNHSQTYVYDELNRLVETIDPMNRSTTFAYDDLSRLTTVSDALKGEASRSYDSLSQVIGYSDPNQNAATYTYDLAGRLIGETNAAGETSTYTYNALGLPDVETNGRGLTTSYNYDAASRLSKFVDQAGEVSYTYDAVGNITAVMDGQGKALTRVFDELDRVVQYTDEFGNVIKYSYDAAGNMIMLTYPDNKTVSYTYDRAGRMTSVTDWSGRVTAYSYDANGRLASTLRPNGTTETRTYDAKGQLLTINDIGLDSSIILSYTYGYDAVGNVISENGGPTVTDSVYLNGLSVGENVYGNVSGSVYVPGDAAGLQPDPAEMQLPPGMSNTEMTYTADNRLATYNGNPVVYDQDGNMITGPLAGSMQSYSYDARNRLMEAGGISYGYNSENVRTSVTVNGVTTRYVVNPQAVLSQVLVETDGQGNPTAYYVYGLGLIGREAADGSYATYHYDRRGSTVALTDDNGVITDTYEYGPYGEQIRHMGTTEQPFQYNGRDGVATDTNGLYHMRARYYNPEIKRFINRDVLTGSISDSQTLNRYAYVNGNPISYVDPFGLSRDGDSAWLQGGSFLADIVPWVGTVKGFQQAFTGNNYITGEQLSAGDRWGEGIGATLSIIPIPGLKHAGKYGTKGVIWAGSKLKNIFGEGTVNTTKKMINACNCFTAGTKVLTDEGEKPIEEIEVGDKVLSKDDETGEVAYKEVVGLFQKQADEIYYVHIGDEIIEATGEHPFWLDGKGWTFVKDLKVGDLLVSSDGSKLAIDKIEKESRKATVYNFEVEDFHSYFVSNLGIWVHNCALVNDLGKGPFVPDEYWGRKAPDYNTPGLRYDHYREYNGKIERSTVIYDGAGRQSYRVDHNNHSMPDDHSTPHLHERRFGPGYSDKGKEYDYHFWDE